jgi:hypothetical protein
MTKGAGVRVWKVLGVAGLAGVAATGVAVARAERRRRAYEPDDIRARLHERHQEALETASAPDPPTAADPGPPEGCLRATLGRLSPRRRRRA